MYEWNCPTVFHRLDLLGCEARDHNSTDTRLRAASLNGSLNVLSGPDLIQLGLGGGIYPLNQPFSELETK